jgi:membrane protease subunit HflK
MAWNEPPPGGGRRKDPWGNRQSEGGPPDLDQVVRKLQEKLGGLFGGGGKSWSGLGAIIGLLVLLLIVWDSAYIIQAPERGVVLRFGRYVDTLEPGLHIRWPQPIEFVEVVNVEVVHSIEHKAAMLTQDENIVDVQLAVQYKIKDVKDYKFKVLGPEVTLQQATESAVRAVIGKNTMDFVITEGRAEIAAGVKDLIQEIVDQFKTGLAVTSVNIHDARAPEALLTAFDDAIKAREDEQRFKNEAEAYRNDILPKARGGAARVKQDAEAYRSRVVAQAEGEANRFSKLLTEYEKAPAVTRQRLYIDSMEAVLSTAQKVLLDTKSGNNMIYLPLDKLHEGRELAGSGRTGAASSNAQQATPLTSEQDLRNQASARNRGER